MSVFPIGGNTAAPFPPFIRIVPSEADVELEREAEIADERAATLAGSDDFDPRDHATAADLDRDLAVSYLIAELPAGMYFRLSQSSAVYRVGAELKTQGYWLASVAMDDRNEDIVITGEQPTPAAAAMALVDLYRQHVASKPASVTLDADEPKPETFVKERGSGRFNGYARITDGKWDAAVGTYDSREQAETAARGLLQSLLREHAAERAARTTGYCGRIDPEKAADAIEIAAAQVGDVDWMHVDADGVVSITPPFRGAKFEDRMLDTARFACDYVNGKVNVA